jgi:hypothetical protein
MNFESVSDLTMNRMVSVPDAKQNIVRLDDGELLLVSIQLPNGQERLIKISSMGWMTLVEAPREKTELLFRMGPPSFAVNEVCFDPRG